MIDYLSSNQWVLEIDEKNKKETEQMDPKKKKIRIAILEMVVVLGVRGRRLSRS